MTAPLKFALKDAQKALGEGTQNYLTLLQHGQGRFLLFAPRGEDTQTPHTQDEVYFVISGSGTFRRGDETVSFAPGDMLFVPAHVPHRFETFSDDFFTWVAFWGPKGGSIPA